jgi:hypothetical protein
MTHDASSASGILTPRLAIHAYLAQLADHRRRLGVVPMNGRWVALETRAAELGRTTESSRIILLELILLFLILTGGSALLLALSCFLAY